MGTGKGILGVESYRLWEKYGYNQFFVVPNLNLFDPALIMNSDAFKEAGFHGAVFRTGNVLLKLAKTYLHRPNPVSIPTKLVWFSYYMVMSFVWSMKVLSTQDNVFCIYAHTPWSVFPVFAVSKLFRVPFMIRAYGIHNYKKGVEGTALEVLSKPDLIIYKIPSNGYIISNDGTMGKKVATRLGVNNEDILFVLDGVNNPANNKQDRKKTRLDFGIPPNKKVALYAGRLIEWKRVDRLLRVFALVKEKIGNNVLLVVAGDGPLRKSLMKLSSELTLENNVIFLGSINHENLRILYSFSDLYVSLQDLTNLSNSVLEAMTQGLCVIAGDSGGTRDVIANMKNGVLVPLSENEKTADIIATLLSNDELRQKIGREGQKYAETTFLDWENRMKKELFWVLDRLQLGRYLRTPYGNGLRFNNNLIVNVDYSRG
jgi:glycosyltransferase involved in cell wall biosynthesis